MDYEHDPRTSSKLDLYGHRGRWNLAPVPLGAAGFLLIFGN
jgi:hypothetical protein